MLQPWYNIFHTLLHYAEVLVIAKFKIRQYILMTDSPNLMLAKVPAIYTVRLSALRGIATAQASQAMACPIFSTKVGMSEAKWVCLHECLVGSRHGMNNAATATALSDNGHLPWPLAMNGEGQTQLNWEEDGGELF